VDGRSICGIEVVSMAMRM